MTNAMTDNSLATIQWLDSLKKATRRQYQCSWEIWLQYCREKDVLDNGSKQLEDMRARRLSSEPFVKFFYDDQVPKFFHWLQTEYRDEATKGPLSESSALSFTTVIRSFFAYHRYSLEIKKEALPSRARKKTVKHTIEVFTSGCPLCLETIQLLNEAKTPACTLTEYNIREQKEHFERARKYGVKAVPSIVVDGKLAIEGKPTVNQVKKVLGL